MEKSYVRYVMKKSSAAQGGIGFELEVVLVEGTSKETILKLGREAISASGELMKTELG